MQFLIIAVAVFHSLHRISAESNETNTADTANTANTANAANTGSSSSGSYPTAVFYKYHFGQVADSQTLGIYISCLGIPATKRWIITSNKCMVDFGHSVAIEEDAVIDWVFYGLNETIYRIESVVQSALYGLKFIKLLEELPENRTQNVTAKAMSEYAAKKACKVLKFDSQFKRQFVNYEIGEMDACQKALEGKKLSLNAAREHDRCLSFKDGSKSVCSFDVGAPVFCDDQLVGVISNSPMGKAAPKEPCSENGDSLIATLLGEFGQEYVNYLAHMDQKVSSANWLIFYPSLIIPNLLIIVLVSF